mmetsp:Transcript_75418/g.104754  ORF Transcript_75418/g.104754 Transcript_75418/m.104754 type:complete len:249 (+) Transcript_75418:23-769(+)
MYTRQSSSHLGAEVVVTKQIIGISSIASINSGPQICPGCFKVIAKELLQEECVGDWEIINIINKRLKVSSQRSCSNYIQVHRHNTSHGLEKGLLVLSSEDFGNTFGSHSIMLVHQRVESNTIVELEWPEASRAIPGSCGWLEGFVMGVGPVAINNCVDCASLPVNEGLFIGVKQLGTTSVSLSETQVPNVVEKVFQWSATTALVVGEISLVIERNCANHVHDTPSVDRVISDKSQVDVAVGHLGSQIT